MYGLFLESITTNDAEIKDNMYPVNIFMLLHETNKVYLSFTNNLLSVYLSHFTNDLSKQFLFSRVNRTVTENIYPMDLKLGTCRWAINRISGCIDQDHCG